MLKLIAYRGLPASGKTTAARKIIAENPNAYKRINRDDLRVMFDNGDWSRDREKFIIKAQSVLITMALEQGRHVLIDDCNLAPSNIARFEQLAQGKATVEVIDLTDVAVETCIERDLKRPNSVGSSVIWKMYWQFLHKPKEPLAQDMNLPEAIIVDIDGTLALHDGRGPYEFEKLDTDRINPAVERIVKWANNRIDGTLVLLVSGREDKYFPATAEWLHRHNIKCEAVMMRPTGDKRRDDIIKLEIYDAHIKGKYRVLFSLDDRDRTVSAWRSLGLPCFQVNYGTF